MNGYFSVRTEDYPQCDPFKNATGLSNLMLQFFSLIERHKTETKCAIYFQNYFQNWLSERALN